MARQKAERMTTRPVYLKITDAKGGTRVEERLDWSGAEEPEFVKSMRKAAAKEGGAVERITQQQYDSARFSGKKGKRK